MKKILTTRLCVYMLLAFVLTISAIFALQTLTNQNNNTASSKAKLEDVRQKLLNNGSFDCSGYSQIAGINRQTHCRPASCH